MVGLRARDCEYGLNGRTLTLTLALALALTLSPMWRGIARFAYRIDLSNSSSKYFQRVLDKTAQNSNPKFEKLCSILIDNLKKKTHFNPNPNE